MCAAKTLSLLSTLGMELCRQGNHPAALMLLARALRQTVRMDTPMAQANIRNNLAIVFQMQGDFEKAMRQVLQAMNLVEKNKGTGNRFFSLLQAHKNRMNQAIRKAA